MIEEIIIFFQIVFIDLVLAGDNAIIIGMVASQFDQNLRKKIKSWGHGDKFRPKTIQEVYQRMEDLTKVILDTKHIQGFCYTQLTDVEQETNGVYLYDRNLKFNMNRIKKIFKGLSLKYKKNYIQ